MGGNFGVQRMKLLAQTLYKWDDVVQAVRLVKEQFGASGKAGGSVLLFVVIRQHDDDRTEFLTLDPLQDRDPTFFRHTDVEDGHVGLVGLDEGEGLARGRSRPDNFDSLYLSHQCAQPVAYGRRIIRNDNFHG